MSNVKTLKLDGAEIAVKFPYSYPYYMIANMGDGEIYVSGNPDIVPYADGVYTVLPGIETRISPKRSGDTVYLLGSGTVQVRAEEIAVQTSFRLAGKGGGTIDLSDYVKKSDIADLKYAGSATTGGTANAAEKDSRGNIIANTYVKTITKNSDGSISLFYGNGTSIVIR